MNFKISFKTWLKVARAELDTGSSSNFNGASQKNQEVEIEVEEYHEVTSEDETFDELGVSSYKGFKGDGLSSRSKSNDGSVNLQDKGSKKNSLALFEKKMTQKLSTQKTIKKSAQKSSVMLPPLSGKKNT